MSLSPAVGRRCVSITGIFVGAMLSLRAIRRRHPDRTGERSQRSRGSRRHRHCGESGDGRRIYGVTTAQGEYRLEHVPIGTYDLKAAKQGFAPLPISKVAVELNRVTTMNLGLALATRPARGHRGSERVHRRSHRAAADEFRCDELVDIPIAAQRQRFPQPEPAGRGHRIFGRSRSRHWTERRRPASHRQSFLRGRRGQQQLFHALTAGLHFERSNRRVYAAAESLRSRIRRRSTAAFSTPW